MNIKKIIPIIGYLILLFFIKTNVTSNNFGHMSQETVIQVGQFVLPISVAVYFALIAVLIGIFIPKKYRSLSYINASASLFTYFMLITYMDSFATVMGFLGLEETTYSRLIQGILLAVFIVDVMLGVIKSEKVLKALAYTPVAICGLIALFVIIEFHVGVAISMLVLSLSLLGFALFIKYKITDFLMRKI